MFELYDKDSEEPNDISTFATTGPITLVSVIVPTLTLTMFTPETKGLFYENILLVVSSTPNRE